MCILCAAVMLIYTCRRTNQLLMKTLRANAHLFGYGFSSIFHVQAGVKRLIFTGEWNLAFVERPEGRSILNNSAEKYMQLGFFLYLQHSSDVRKGYISTSCMVTNLSLYMPYESTCVSNRLNHFVFGRVRQCLLIFRVRLLEPENTILRENSQGAVDQFGTR